MKEWFVLQSPPADAAGNMALDEALMRQAPALGRPVLRFYSWTEPAASFGYFQRFADVAQLTPLRPLVRRPTGGGIVPHDADWTYSVTIPPADDWYSIPAIESYRRIHEWLRDAFARLGVETEVAPRYEKAGPGQCFVGHEKFDLLWHGRKIAGAAQRRSRSGLLIQGSVQPASVNVSRADWEQAMRACRADQTAWTELKPASNLVAEAAELVSRKYSRPEYNRQR